VGATRKNGLVIEWHGWATIRPSATNEDLSDEVIAATIAEVRSLVDSASGIHNEVVDLRNANGMWHVWLAGCHNHVASVTPLFAAIASAALGSYGLLYVHDDENEQAAEGWEVWVMKRGTVVAAADPFLSPFHPAVEDYFRESDAPRD
jgi:hypothetical protein